MSEAEKPDNYISLDRTSLSLLATRLPPRVAGAAMSVFLRMLIEANHTPGYFEGAYLERGDVNVSESKLCKRTGHTRQTIRSSICALIGQKEIVKKATNEGANGSLVYRICNYNTYNVFLGKLANEVTSNQPGSNQVVTTSKEEEGRIRKEKEEDQRCTPDADSPQDVIPSTPRQRPRVASSKTPADPQTNPKPILEEIELAGTVILWGKDGKLLKGLMQSRVRAGVQDVPAEVRDRWGVFKASADEGTDKYGHTVGVFLSRYNALLEQAKGNGRSAANAVQYIITNGYDGKPIKDPAKRLGTIVRRWRDYYSHLPHILDPDKGAPGCTWALPDEIILETIEKAKNGTWDGGIVVETPEELKERIRAREKELEFGT